VDRILANGNVRVESEDSGRRKFKSNQVELLHGGEAGQSAVGHILGDVRMENSGPHSMQGSAGRVVLNFTEITC